MAEYIEREALLAHIKDLPTWSETANGFISRKYPFGMFDCDDVVGGIVGSPTADVAPVVLCKDCTHAELFEGSDCLYCMNIAGLCTYVMDDDYCSYGERKDSEENAAD